jgi:NADH-quinone oxidoreductase chain G
MLNIKIEDIHLSIKSQVSVLEACKYVGISIPRFCYHETLSISGNCRMCLVEIEGLEKPLASCVAEIDEGMSIWTDSPFVKKARENIIEVLLLNHPLDCPICDQAGECDLQDQTKIFGGSYSRFFFNKTTIEDKNCGPLIKTIMTRCIKCTRCVRYSTEIAGIDFFGTVNRGNGTEIGSYISKIFESEISGNVIDLCPVGALTSKPYAFKARPWELRLSESIDITDSLGSNIYVNFKETEIFRVIAKKNKNLNGSFISDKARFSYDSNNTNRLNSIYYSNDHKHFKTLSWLNLFKIVDKLLESNSINFLVDEKCDVETIYTLKFIKNKFKKNINISFLSKTNSKSNLYISNKTNIVSKINDTKDLVILIGSNLRLENSILNNLLRFRYKNTMMKIYSNGLCYNENIPTTFINLNIIKIINIFEGKSILFSKSIFLSKTPLIFIGENLSDRVDNINNFINNLYNVFPSSNIILLNNISNSEGLSFLNLKYKHINNVDNMCSINLDDTITNRRLLKNSKNSFWLSTHGSYLATKFNIIVPILTSFETEQIYINLEERPQKTKKSFKTFFDSRKVVDILSSIFNVQNVIKKENYLSSTLEQVLNLELFNSLDKISSPFKFVVKNITLQRLFFVSISKYAFKQKLKDFYCSDTFTLNSKIMVKCHDYANKNFINFYNKN